MQNHFPAIFKKLFIVLLVSVSTSSQAMTDKRSELSDQTSVAVTIYNENLALIKDQRTVNLAQGLNLLAFRGVSAKMRPETTLLRNLKNANLSVLEQNFDFDLLTPQKMLEKYVGKEINIATLNPFRATGKYWNKVMPQRKRPLAQQSG